MHHFQKLFDLGHKIKECLTVQSDSDYFNILSLKYLKSFVVEARRPLITFSIPYTSGYYKFCF